MNVTENTPRSEYSIHGITVRIPAPYTDGMTIGAGEAKVLNMAVSEAVRNNRSAAVEKLPEGPDRAAEAQRIVDEFIASYELGVRKVGSGGRVTDPVEREALRLALEAVRNAIIRQPAKYGQISKYSHAQLSAKAKEFLQHDVYGPKFRKDAKANVAKMSKDELDLGELAPETTAEDQGEAPTGEAPTSSEATSSETAEAA